MSQSLNTPTKPKPLPAKFLALLREVFSKKDILTSPEECWAYGYDNSRLHRLPQAVVFPTKHEQVVSAVKSCHQFRIALTVRGRGTGTTGATVPLHNGVVMSLERMNKVLGLNRTVFFGHPIPPVPHFVVSAVI